MNQGINKSYLRNLLVLVYLMISPASACNLGAIGEVFYLLFVGLPLCALVSAYLAGPLTQDLRKQAKVSTLVSFVQVCGSAFLGYLLTFVILSALPFGSAYPAVAFFSAGISYLSGLALGESSSEH